MTDESSEAVEFETACVCCGGITKYKITPEQKWYKEIKKSIESGEDLRFIDICGFCVKEQTMVTKFNCIQKALYDENGKRR